MAIADGSVLIVGEMEPRLTEIILDYKGNSKNFLLQLARQLGSEPEKITIDSLKESISDGATGQIIWLKNAQRIPMGMRFWIADLDFRLILQCDRHPRKDIFLDATALEVPRLSQPEIFALAQQEAIALGILIPPKRLQKIIAGTRSRREINSVIRCEKLGLPLQYQSGGDYFDISPIFLSVLAGFGILRFMGMATGDRNLYIFGGICMMLGLMFKYLSKLK